MKYRKKPIVIDAWQFRIAQDGPDIAKWCGGRFEEHPKPSDPTDIYSCIVIPTLEGNMQANLGDYVIKGVQGEFYPCKPDIFQETYEAMP